MCNKCAKYQALNNHANLNKWHEHTHVADEETEVRDVRWLTQGHTGK